jgi:3-deoxy-manno-octulosonate cytidylyltransferase (CMP-KDO synthetase)
MTASVLVLIPARLGATRLPRKPLADIHGAPMIAHVWRRAAAAGIGRVAVATDAPEIAAAVKAVGGEYVMTAADHANGSSRIEEAARLIDPGAKCDVVVNLQGDLPTIEPGALAACLDPLSEPAVDIATIAAVMTRPEERGDENVVKIAGFENGPRRMRALYFSRSPIPFGPGPLFHHIGVYAYRRAALARYVKLPPTALERRERLEQLRAMEAGMRIDVAVVDAIPIGVDTPADLERARAALAPRK